MSEHPVQLQRRGIRESAYERPTSHWLCGYHPDGTPCRRGPDARGLCRAVAECQPVRKGDRWECTRPTYAGGHCPETPRPDGACAHPIERCVPVRSVAGRRAVVVRWALLGAVGLLSIGLSGPVRDRFISAGPLSAGHAFLNLPQHGACSACHVPGASGGSRARAVSAGCIACHAPIAGAHAFTAHGLEPGVLAERTRRQLEAYPPRGLSLASLGRSPHDAQREVACSTCHREHHGRDTRAAMMGAASCQGCHTAPFGDFARGHPEFAARPATGAVAFNHAAHNTSRFGSRSVGCETCHRLGPRDQPMRIGSFETTCVGCHDQDSRDHHGDQIRKAKFVALQFPDLGLEAPAPWRAEAMVGESLTPLMRLLLAGAPDGPALDAVMALYEDEDAEGVPFEWLAQDEQKLALGHAVERVITDLAAGDPAALTGRLARALDVPREAQAVLTLAHELTAGGAAAELFLHQVLREGGAPNAAAPRGTAGWRLVASEASVEYEAAGHRDPFFRAIADLLAARADGGSDKSFSDAATFRRFIRTAVFRDLSAARGVAPLTAACLRCHAVEPDGAAFRILWSRPFVQAERLARFAHAPHTQALGKAGQCSSCHVIQRVPAVETEAAPRATGFGPPRKSTCMTCHAPGGASTACTTCHRYHGTPRTLLQTQAALPAGAASGDPHP